MSQLFTPDERTPGFRVQRLCGVLSFLSLFVLMVASQISAQDDDPDGLLVPPGLRGHLVS